MNVIIRRLIKEGWMYINKELVIAVDRERFLRRTFDIRIYIYVY